MTTKQALKVNVGNIRLPNLYFYVLENPPMATTVNIVPCSFNLSDCAFNLIAAVIYFAYHAETIPASLDSSMWRAWIHTSNR